MIERIEHRGMLIKECSIPGETRADEVYPSHPNGTQVSRDKFLLVYATRGFRGTDDDRSTVYQLREGGFDGRLIKEGILGRSTDDWEPLEDGVHYVREHGSPAVFGVPRGACTNGKPAPHANLFVIRWRQQARRLDPATGLMLHMDKTPAALGVATDAVLWTQVRLNEAENDIEVVQAPRILRQRGFASGYAFCEAGATTMMHGAQPVPYNREGTQWIEMAWFVTLLPGMSAAKRERAVSMGALLHEFNFRSGLYEWMRTGALTAGAFFEPNILPYKDGWVVCARERDSARPSRGLPVPWWRTDDPFAPLPDPVRPVQPRTTAPILAYRCPDGGVRMVTTDSWQSTTADLREPLHCIEVDPDRGFAMVNRHLVFDGFASGLPIRRESIPSIDMGKILPHSGGDTQYLLHRVRPTSTKDPARTGHRVNQAEMDASAIYCATIHYDRAYRGPWTFTSGSVQEHKARGI